MEFSGRRIANVAAASLLRRCCVAFVPWSVLCARTPCMVHSLQLVVVGASTRLCDAWTSSLPAGALTADAVGTQQVEDRDLVGDGPLPLDMHLDVKPLTVVVREVDSAQPGPQEPAGVATSTTTKRGERYRWTLTQAEGADILLFGAVVFFVALVQRRW